jgi:putative membrane protein
MLHHEHTSSGLVVMIVAAWYLLLASLAMGLADLLGKWHPRGGSIRGTLGSSVPPLVALVAQGFWG